ncbi:uncharacterized protein LOC135309976 [Plodia interpunctella]|uniref:uncharacterized protein LOC135309976 n=1 Tax=Plodia interpunctella TaxID=58824 RepID=UPI003100E949
MAEETTGNALSLAASLRYCEPRSLAASLRYCEPRSLAASLRYCEPRSLAASLRYCEPRSFAASLRYCEPRSLAASLRYCEPRSLAASLRYCEPRSFAASLRYCEPRSLAASLRYCEPRSFAASLRYCEPRSLAASLRYCEPRSLAASQCCWEPRSLAASQCCCEPRSLAASQCCCEPRSLAASQCCCEPRSLAASQCCCEPPSLAASQCCCEPRSLAASQCCCEPRSLAASQCCCEPPSLAASHAAASHGASPRHGGTSCYQRRSYSRTGRSDRSCMDPTSNRMCDRDRSRSNLRRKSRDISDYQSQERMVRGSHKSLVQDSYYHSNNGSCNNAHERSNEYCNINVANSAEDNFTKLVNVMKSILPKDSFDKLNSIHNTIPEFDPSHKGQTMTMWIHKVNESATIYNWSEKQTIHFALPKLRGVAQRWYEGLSSVLFTWKEWQEKLQAAFPSDENYGQMLSDMLAKRARFGDSLEDYYYNKIILINRCGITGKRAVECILHGIDDRSVRLGAEAVQYDDPNKLLSYLRNSRYVKTNNDRRISSKNQVNNKNDNSQSSHKVKCYNCKEEGHVSSKCTQPVKKCGRCLKIGHETEQCFSRLPNTQKVVMKVDKTDTINGKYFKNVKINNNLMEAFIDLGSECSMIKLSESKFLNNDLDTNDLPTLRGFGNSIVKALGKIRVKVVIDDVQADIDIFVVPDDVMHMPLLIGQSFTEQPHILICKTSDNLEITQLPNVSYDTNKIKIFCKNDVQVSGLTAIEVYTGQYFCGDLFIEGDVRFKSAIKYSVLSGLFTFNESTGTIVLNNLHETPLTLHKDFLVARGRAALELTITKPLEVLTTSTILQNPKFAPITDTDIKMDILSLTECPLVLRMPPLLSNGQ